MDEIRLINILASQPQNVKQPGITDSNSTNLPPVITRFPPGSILAGFIINRDAQGNPILRTPESGDITFQTNLFLKIGAEVVIRIETRSGHPQAHILTIDGQPPEHAEKVSVVPQPRDNAPTSYTPPQPRPASPIDVLTAATTRPAVPAATISTQPSITATVTSNTPALPQGTQITVNVVSAEAPEVAQTNTASTSQPTAQTAQAANPHYAAYARAAATPATPPVPASVTPAPASVPNATPQAQTPVIVGQNLQLIVVGSTQSGQTIAQTPEGATIQLNTTAPLTPGIKLNVEISQINRPVQGATTVPALPEEPAPVASLARQWNSIQQIVSLLSASAAETPLSASGLALLANLNPPSSSGSGITPQSISTGLMAFIAALRGGDFRGWLGMDNAKRLEDSGHTQLLKKAEGEFLNIARQWNEAQPSQWQSLFFPVAAHGEVQQARLFVKRDRKHQKHTPGSEEEDTRFIVEVELSQMGELQLDGFIRKDPKSMEFDLFVRTRQPLDEEAQKAIFAIYNDTGSLTGYKGTLVFQTVSEFPVHPMEQAITEHASDVKI